MGVDSPWVEAAIYEKNNQAAAKKARAQRAAAASGSSSTEKPDKPSTGSRGPLFGETQQTVQRNGSLLGHKRNLR